MKPNAPHVAPVPRNPGHQTPGTADPVAIDTLPSTSGTEDQNTETKIFQTPGTADPVALSTILPTATTSGPFVPPVLISPTADPRIQDPTTSPHPQTLWDLLP